MKKQTPLNIWVRFINNGKKISVGIYINNKRRNLYKPFKKEDQETIKDLAKYMIFEQTRLKRPIQLAGNQETINYLNQQFATLQ